MKGKSATCSPPTTYINGIIMLSLLGATTPIEFFIRTLLNNLADGSNETGNAILISLKAEELAWKCRLIVGFAASVTVICRLLLLCYFESFKSERYTAGRVLALEI